MSPVRKTQTSASVKSVEAPVAEKEEPRKKKEEAVETASQAPQAAEAPAPKPAPPSDVKKPVPRAGDAAAIGRDAGTQAFRRAKSAAKGARTDDRKRATPADSCGKGRSGRKRKSRKRRGRNRSKS